MPVKTAEGAEKFAKLLLQQRLTFDAPQLRAMRRGMSTVVPVQLIRLWAWQDLQDKVCGVHAMDLDMLKRHTTYKNCTSANECVGFLWEVLEGLTRSQQQTFVRFVSGRGSLPSSEPWDQPFTLELSSAPDEEANNGRRESEQEPSAQGSAQRPVTPPTQRPNRDDDCAPRARPHAFLLILPQYSSVDVCRNWMLHCVPRRSWLDESAEDLDVWGQPHKAEESRQDL